MDRATRARVDSLLYEVRSWEPGLSISADALEDLARRFRLDPLIVQRLLESEGVRTPAGRALEPEEAAIDHGRRVTSVIPPEVVEQMRRKLAGEDDD